MRYRLNFLIVIVMLFTIIMVILGKYDTKEQCRMITESLTTVLIGLVIVKLIKDN